MQKHPVQYETAWKMVKLAVYNVNVTSMSMPLYMYDCTIVTEWLLQPTYVAAAIIIMICNVDSTAD